LIVWDIASGQVVQRLEGHSGYVTANGCAFLPNGRRIVSAAWGGEIFVWNRATGKRTREFSSGHLDSPSSLALSPDGREVMVGTLQGRVTAWDLGTSRVTFHNEDLSRGGHDSVWTVGYFAEGRRFGGAAHKIVVWGNGPGREFAAAGANALPLPDGGLVFAGKDGVYVADAAGTSRRLGAHDKGVYGLAMSPHHDVVVAGDDAGSTRVWSLATGALQCELPRTASIMAAAFDPAGSRFAVGGDDATVVVARATDCAVTQTLGARRTRASRILASDALVVGDGAGTISIWSATDFRASHSTRVHTGEVMALSSLGPDRWVSGGTDGLIFFGT
jgi:WD40 repeat protein